MKSVLFVGFPNGWDLAKIDHLSTEQVWIIWCLAIQESSVQHFLTIPRTQLNVSESESDFLVF